MGVHFTSLYSTLLYICLSQEENSSSTRDDRDKKDQRSSALLHQWFGSRYGRCFGGVDSSSHRLFLIGFRKNTIDIVFVMATPLRVGCTRFNILPPFGIRLTRTIIASLTIGNTQTVGRHSSVGISRTIDITLVCYDSGCIQSSAAIFGTQNSRTDIFTLSTAATNHHNEEWQHHHRHHHDRSTQKADHHCLSYSCFLFS